MEYSRETVVNDGIIRIYSNSELKIIHSLCIFHKPHIKQNNHRCGCFYCLEIFDSSKIKEWTDNQTTALCPECQIDSVIYDSEKYPLTETLLLQMQKKYFACLIEDVVE